MPKDVEMCVSKLKGTNKRTGKPYTQSEKWAICTAMHNKMKDKSSLNEEELILDEETVATVETILYEATRKLLSNGRAKTWEEAENICETFLTRSNFDVNNMRLLIDRETK